MTRARFYSVSLLTAALILLVVLIPVNAGAQAAAPGAPTIDTATVRAGWLPVEWSAPSGDGGSAVTAYDMRRIETDAADKADAKRTDAIIRGFGAPDLTAQLLNEHGAVLAQNNDGNLAPRSEGFVIRRTLNAGTYSLSVSSHQGITSGGYTVYVTEAGNPGSAISGAQAITLEDAAGGNITSTGDADYFSITVDETTYVQIWAAPNDSGTDVDAQLLDDSETAVDADYANNFDSNFANVFSFGIAHQLDAGTYYVKVTGSGSSTGRYTIIALEDLAFSKVAEDCKDISRGGIADTWYGCQWHLQDDGLFGSGSTGDINVEGVWSGGNLGEGIHVKDPTQGQQLPDHLVVGGYPAGAIPRSLSRSVRMLDAGLSLRSRSNPGIHQRGRPGLT